MKKFLKTAWRVGEWENGHFLTIVQKFIDKISFLNFGEKLGDGFWRGLEDYFLVD